MESEREFTPEDRKRLRRFITMGSGCVGLVIAFVFIVVFVLLATRTPRDSFHFPPPKTAACVSCHERGVDDAGVVPHVPIPYCASCHRPQKR